MGVKTRIGPKHKSPVKIPINVSWKEAHDAMREETIYGLQKQEGLTREERAGQKKTSIRFPVDLHRALKVEAAKEGKSLSEFIIERLSEALSNKK